MSMSGSRHVHALVGSLGRLARTPFSTGLTVLVIALALALPTSLRLLVLNAEAATGGFSNAIDISVYLKTRSEEHTFELQSHNAIAYAVFCL